mgnify:CR=1 FL=1|jgi:hypothetical protein
MKTLKTVIKIIGGILLIFHYHPINTGLLFDTK